jgi:hypothetical protein
VISMGNALFERDAGMEYLGMLSLGGFVGAFLCFGLNHVSDMDSFQKGVSFILGSAFAGVVLGFIQMWNDSGSVIAQGLPMYPVGLLLALFWYYAAFAVANMRDVQILNKILGIAHMVAVVALTALAVLLVVPDAFVATRYWGGGPVVEPDGQPIQSEDK